MSEGDEAELKVMRCSTCGDTFPVEGEEVACPSCGGVAAEIASEPLL